MKIESPSNKIPVNLTESLKNVERQPDRAGIAKEEISAFNVEISDTVKQMIKTLPGEDDVRRDKVAAIRDQLASGSYNISGKDVASKILNALKNGG